MKVLLSSGECGIIEATRDIHYDKPKTTYNFEVADFHTYYVGTGVLVHNKCDVIEYQMTKEEAIKYGKEFLGEGYEQIGKDMYRSADKLRTLHIDSSGHPFRGEFYSGPNSPTHINLYTWRVPVESGVRNMLLSNIHIWLI